MGAEEEGAGEQPETAAAASAAAEEGPLEQQQQLASSAEDVAEESTSGEEEDYEEDEEAGVSSDADEGLPLSKRPSWADKHGLPQPTAPPRTRQNRFPKIPKSERCGKCENCLNPQRKKACIVARQRMEERMKQQQQQPSVAAAKPGAGATLAAAPAPTPAAAAAAADDAFARSLSGILSSSGGVAQERHVTMLLQLVKRAKSRPHRTALLAVLQLSAGEVLRQAVAGGLLLELQAWLSEFVAEGKQAMVQKALSCLDKLPVTLASLQPPCELGKIVGRLRKHEGFGSPVIEPAKRLVARWKAMVDQAMKAGGSSTGSGPASATQTAKAGGGVQPLERQASGGTAAAAAAMEDGDLFKSADRQRAGIKDAVPAVKKTVTIKTITVEPTRGVKPASDSAQPASASGAAATQPAAGGSSKAEGSGSGGAPGLTDISKVSASPFASLGGLGGLSSLGSGVTMLGGSSGGLLPLSTVGPSSSGAKERAAAAARRVPSPEPQPRKEKKKKVAWVEEEALVGVRWFRKDDPPAAAQQDVDLTQAAAPASAAPAAAPASAVTREPSPPGFESAAKKEHLSEAEALRRHRQEEDHERHELEKRLALMVPTTAWLNPLQNDATSPAELEAMSGPPARGEDSTEAAAASARRQQVQAAVYASLAAVPDCPAEPGTMADHGVVQHVSTIPRIPLSLEEASAMQQQQQQGPQQGESVGAVQQQKQQQPPHQQHQVQPPQQAGGQAAAPAVGPPQQPPAAQQQQQRQQQQQQPRGQAPPQDQAMRLPDISAALAQLAASGILNPAGAGGGAPGSAPVQQQGAQGQAMPPPALARPAGPAPGLPPPATRPAGPLPGPPPGPRQLPAPPGNPQGPPGHGRQLPPPLQPPSRRPYNQRACRYFNTPQGCYMGDRCNFAHVPLPGNENGRGDGGSGGKRPAESDYGRPGKQPRSAGWGGSRP